MGEIGQRQRPDLVQYAGQIRISDHCSVVGECLHDLPGGCGNSEAMIRQQLEILLLAFFGTELEPGRRGKQCSDRLQAEELDCLSRACDMLGRTEEAGTDQLHNLRRHADVASDNPCQVPGGCF